MLRSSQSMITRRCFPPAAPAVMPDRVAADGTISGIGTGGNAVARFVAQQDRQMHVIDQVRPVCDVPISALQAWLGGQHLCQRCLFFSEPSIAEVIGVRHHTVIG